MRRLGLLRLALGLAFVAGVSAARADGLIVSLSSREVVIASNYQGGSITVFGAALDKDGEVRPPGPYDLVVTVRGPLETIDVREKTRVLGMWINRRGRDFVRAPTFLAVLTNRPVAEIADPATLKREDLGLEAAAERRIAGAGERPTPEDAAFVAALRRLQEGRRLWREDARGVDFIGASLFQGEIALPPNVPFGTFDVEVRLMQQGETLARQTTSFQVVKSNFEARVAGLAEDRRLAYGLVAVGLALLLGWLASVIFRRD
ncbi:TIGR02186 family protein [Chelatococcus sambhunathii]|uniref:TIGR02186 family protein n=1 Tax=Chelatococcus sambhunathii TaxID=363953 RepID=A0ABU1DF84_9HYPH|nr:TIGR02186 family protein [Chelatococcus sambhunathii]MDR4306765.1 TIGR02186 family protein [Chelatococcus sambhunathii]